MMPPHQNYKTNSVIAMTMLTGEDTLDYSPHLMTTRTNADTTGANSYRTPTFNQTIERCDLGNNTTLRPATVALHRHSQLIWWGKPPVKIMAQSMSYYAHRVNSFKLLAHVNCLMGVVHTTCRTTMLIAMYFGEYPIYLSAGHILLSHPLSTLSNLILRSPQLDAVHALLVLLHRFFRYLTVS